MKDLFTKLTSHFLGYTFPALVQTPFDLPNCLNSSYHGFNKQLETFLRDFGPDLIASRDCCRFVSCIPMIWFSHSTTSQRFLLDWHLETLEGIWEQWTHCFVEEISSVHMLCLYKCSSAYLGQIEWLFHETATFKYPSIFIIVKYCYSHRRS